MLRMSVKCIGGGCGGCGGVGVETFAKASIISASWPVATPVASSYMNIEGGH